MQARHKAANRCPRTRAAIPLGTPVHSMLPLATPSPTGASSTMRNFMRYGFVIDQDRCIGCHACTVACKEEHQVPLGVFRTWVKYVEKGQYPHTSRHFGVMRCNHCDSAPCVTICPTQALYRRSDGIIDFDN